MKLHGVREAIHEATALHLRKRNGLDPFRYGCHIDRSASGSADSLIVDAIEAGRILSSIEKLRPMVRDWLLYAYGADTGYSKNKRAYLSHGLYRIHLQDGPATMPVRLTFSGLAVDDARSRYTNGRSLSHLAFCTVLGLQEFTWKRDGWKGKLEDLQQEIERLDREGLAQVEETIDKLRSGTES